MKIYTRTGDAGSTGLFAGPRVAKCDARIEALGTVDELNAVLGVARSQLPVPQSPSLPSAPCDLTLDQQLEQVQSDLFSVGARLATGHPEQLTIPRVGDAQVQQMEQWIDSHEQRLSPLTHFILPAGTSAAATLHLSRTVCRRAERRVVAMNLMDIFTADDQRDFAGIIIYLNRLSDYLFVVARLVNQNAGIPDVLWAGQT